MTEVDLSRDNQLELTPMVRALVSNKIHSVLDALEPYIDGTMGPVSPRHLQQYLAALKLLGQMYRVFDRAEQAPDAGMEELGAAQMRQQVLRTLLELESRAG